MASNFVGRGAAAYDALMGRWSRRLAPLFVDFAGVAPGERVLDVGCGTGNLAFEIAAREQIASIEAIDFDERFVEAVLERNTDERIAVRQGDACALPFADDTFDRALAMLVFHFVPDAPRAIAELLRVTRPGGVGAATVWDTFGGQISQRLLYDVMATLEPTAVERRRAQVFRPMTQQGELRDAFAAAGFTQVTETMLAIRMDFANFADYWQPLMKGQGTHAAFLESLPEQRREEIVSGVQAAYLCGRPDGPRSFASVAWAVRGVAP